MLVKQPVSTVSQKIQASKESQRVSWRGSLVKRPGWVVSSKWTQKNTLELEMEKKKKEPKAQKIRD